LRAPSWWFQFEGLIALLLFPLIVLGALVSPPLYFTAMALFTALWVIGFPALGVWVVVLAIRDRRQRGAR
jgi:hypothetical protein